MLNYIEYLNVPSKIAIFLVGTFLILQIIGELLEFKGKIVPECLKIRKYFMRKKKERLALGEMTELLEEHNQMSQTILNVNRLLTDINEHYSEDNIAMRNNWMKEVNEHIEDSEDRNKRQDNIMRELSDKLEKTNNIALSILIDNKRNAIIDFASRVANSSAFITREQFKRIFKIHEEYESIIKEYGMTNGEVDIAYRIIVESYEDRLKNSSFIEDIRGYNILGGE